MSSGGFASVCQWSGLSGCQCNSTDVGGAFLQVSTDISGWWVCHWMSMGSGGHVSGCQWACEWGIFALHQAALARPAVGVGDPAGHPLGTFVPPGHAPLLLLTTMKAALLSTYALIRP